MTAARRSEEALHGRNCRTMWAVIHRTDGGRLLFARKADLPRQGAAISGSAGWYCRSLASLPPSPAQPARRRIGACPVVGARPAAIRRSNAACPRHGDRRRNPRPTGRVCKVLELSGARVESFALQTAFVCVLIEHVSPHGGIDFLTHQLSTSVGGRLADHDGLLERVETQDWQHGALAPSGASVPDTALIRIIQERKQQRPHGQ